jgi:hypothetical protein
MFTKRFRVGVLLVMTVMLALGAYTALAQASHAPLKDLAIPQWALDRQQYDSTFVYEPSQAYTPSQAPLRVEVAEDGARFLFGKDYLFPDGLPAYGSPFVTQGYLYPEGTLNGSNGVLEDGSPEFPDKVIGEWTCYGYMIGEAGHATTGEWVVSTQIYKLYEQDALIVTNGFELADLNVPAARAITGGTGAFSNASGEQIQELLGFTEQMGVNLVVEFNIH